MKRYRFILSLEDAIWIPATIRTLFKVNVRWRTVVKRMTQGAVEEVLSAMPIASAITGIGIERVEEDV
jgi:hypothetical protein